MFFPKLEINTELIVKIVSFENYLKSALQNLKNFKVIAKNFTNTRDKLNNDYGSDTIINIAYFIDKITNNFIY